MRVMAVISYDGSKFFGFQAQKESQKHTKPTVLSKLEEVFKTLNIDSKIEGSGRTDKGVHASGQVIAFDIPEYWSDLDKLKNNLNAKLDYIRFKTIKLSRDDFSPRFEAKKRVYRYIISTGEKTPFLYDFVSFVDSVDEEKIKKAIKLFEGEHDFALFRKSGSDEKSTIRTIYKARFYKYKNFFVFCFEGSAFLRSQIRMMVAALLKVSSGSASAQELKMQIENKKRFSSLLADANGLYLAKVNY